MWTYRVIRNKKAHRRKLAARRFVTISSIIGVFVFTGYTLHASRMERLVEATAQLAYYEARLSNVRIRQDYYRNVIVRLDDEDYVAMLAREHLWSLPNETVFIIEDLAERSQSSEENYEN